MMDVGVSKSHVFLNYSPRALFSQWDTHLHGGAVCSLDLRGPNLLHRWFTSSALNLFPFMSCSSCIEKLQKELDSNIYQLMEWLEVGQLQ